MARIFKRNRQFPQPVYRHANASEIANMLIFLQQPLHPIQISSLYLFQFFGGIRPEKKCFPLQIPVKYNQVFLIIPFFQFPLYFDQTIGISVISVSLGLVFH